MNKKIGLTALLLSLAACSSSSTKNSDGSLEATDKATTESAVSEVSTDSVAAKVAATEPIEKPKAAPPPAVQMDALSDAIKTQNDEKMYTTATQILTQSPTDMKALNTLAMYQYKKGRFEVSKFLLAKAIAAHPKASELYSNMGLVLLAQNERRDAVKSFRRALEIDNGDAVASANLGAMYVHDQDYNKALIVLETAYRKGMRDGRVLNNYGIALTANKKFDKAEEVYKAALKDQSSNKELLLNYAILLVDNLSKYQEGLEVIGKLKFVGGSSESKNRVSALENKARAGAK